LSLIVPVSGEELHVLPF